MKNTKTFPCSDLGNAERFAKEWGAKFYISESGKTWYHRGHRIASETEIYQAATTTVRKLLVDAKNQKEIDFALKSQNLVSIRNMLKLAKSEPEFARH